MEAEKKNSKKALLRFRPAAHVPVHPDPLRDQQRRWRVSEIDQETLDRRATTRLLVDDALGGCPTASERLAHINSYFTSPSTPNLTFSHRGYRISTKDFDLFEYNLISRYNIVLEHLDLTRRRILQFDYAERIESQLFPLDRGHLMKPELFAIFVNGVAEEGIFPKEQAKEVIRLQVIAEEWQKGDSFNGPTRRVDAYESGLSAIVIFDMPKDTYEVINMYRPNYKRRTQDLYKHLQILIEAAVYEQEHWKGFYLANARSKLNDYHQAWKLTEADQLTPPHLTSYKRNWSYPEKRLLQRGKLLCDLLTSYESGTLTDYGIYRAVRGTFVHLDGQPFHCKEDLESFLYVRYAESGLALDAIPEILKLHPENDQASSTGLEAQHLTAKLAESKSMFDKEECERLSDLEASYHTFESVKKAQMTRWQRCKYKLSKLLRKMKKYRKNEPLPFDPFSAEHKVEGLGFGSGAASGRSSHRA